MHTIPSWNEGVDGGSRENFAHAWRKAVVGWFDIDNL